MTILFILIAILFFGVLIAVHEFGHSIAAKTLGMRVEEFAVGMSPRLLPRTKGETAYSLRVLPIGRFCSMGGEEEASDDPWSFSGKLAWKKLIILVAGAFLSFVTGLVILLVFFSVTGGPSTPVVSGYLPGAKGIRETDLLPGDEFYRIDGHHIYFQSDAIPFLGRTGEDVAAEVLWDSRRLDLDALHLPYRTLTDENNQQSLKRGVTTGKLREAGPLGTLRNTWYQSTDYVRTVWLSLGDLIRGTVSLNSMAGPINIFAVADEVNQQGVATAGVAGALLNTFSFVALVAINLAVMNLLSVPALDGGQILFLLVGGIYHFFAHRRIDQKYLGYISMTGFFCLIALMVAVAVSGVNKLIL